MPTKQVCECYCCGKEIAVDKGEMRDLPYDEYIGQVFLCLKCIAEDERVIEQYDNGDSYAD